jgi:3-oxoadipate enol-lactonase
VTRARNGFDEGIAYTETGPSGSPPVVLIHGLGDDRTLWRHVAPVLAERHRVVAIDLPGHGASAEVPEGASIEWFAATVARFMVKLDLQDAVLMGLSMGGGVAQYIAIEQNVSLRGLVLVSTSPVVPEATRQRFLSRAESAEQGGMAAVVDQTVSRWFTPAFAAAHPDDVERTRSTVLRTDPRSFARASRANAARDCTDRLPNIRCPVLFIAGLEDPADPRRAETIYRDQLKDIRIRLLPDVSHLLPVEAPQAFTREVVAFLGALPVRAAGAA